MNSLFVTIPHSGEEVAPEAPWLENLPEVVLMRDVDRYVDQLYEPALRALSLPWVKTKWHRYLVDLNRLPTDIDTDSVIGAPHPAGTYPRGLHWSITTLKEKLMPQPIAMELHQKIVQKYYEPFHAEVRALQKKLQMASVGPTVLYHIDAHSMPSMGTSEHRDPGERRKDIVVSDCSGKSCSPEFSKLVAESYQNAGFSVAVNWPYAGGRVTEIYGKPNEGHHSIQVELNRALYMNEETKQKLTDGSFAQVQERILKALTRVQSHLR